VIRLALWRLAGLIPVMLIVSGATFLLQSLNPTDPAEELLGGTATAEQVAALRAEMGLDRPVLARYVDWLGSAVGGDLGHSIYTGLAVAPMIVERFWVTISLTAGALFVALVLGVPTGIAASLRVGGRLDRLMMSATAVAQGVPAIWLGTLLLSLFAVRWQLFNAVFYVAPSESVTGWLRSITLPSIALGLAPAAVLARHARASMVGVLGEEYIRAALAKGASRRQVVVHHALRNAARPLVSVIAFQAAALFGASFVVERIFALPGLGSLAIEAINRNDPAPLLGFVLAVVVAVVVVNLVLDLTYGWLDPRVRAT
jgi:peptide/nickel transport system permease protein